MNEWRINNGYVPDEVTGDDVRVIVHYRDGVEFEDDCLFDPDYWILQGNDQDIVKWRLA